MIGLGKDGKICVSAYIDELITLSCAQEQSNNKEKLRKLKEAKETRPLSETEQVTLDKLDAWSQEDLESCKNSGEWENCPKWKEWIEKKCEESEKDCPKGLRQKLTDQKSMNPFGNALFKLLTMNARVTSGVDKTPPDPPEVTEQVFWQWIAATQTWMVKMSEWQAGVKKAFDKKENGQLPSFNETRDAVLKLADPGVPPVNAPTVLKGRIE